MNYRDTFSRFEESRQHYSHKTQGQELEHKNFSGLSPRLTGYNERSTKAFEIYKEKPSFTAPRSPDSFVSHPSSGSKRNMSSSKSTVQISKLSDVELENKNLKEKVANLQRERDIIKNWNKVRNKDDPHVYKEKLNFLVKNIQKFLQSSLKFQSMLREKMGVNVANLYEEERNLLKSQVVSATEDYEIPFKYSPMTSPLRNQKSPRIDEFSSVDSETTRVLEELRNEKAKNKKLQNELTVEMALKDEEMRNIRDRLMELEKIEKGKLEAEKHFAKSLMGWENERKDLFKELDKFKGENKRLKEKLNEFDEIYTEMKDDNSSIKIRCEEMIQENFKLSESLQTYDRLYNYSKKWAEKAVEEIKEGIEGTIGNIELKFENNEKRIMDLNKGLDKLKHRKGEAEELGKVRMRVKELENEVKICYEKVKREEGKNEKLNEKLGDALLEVEDHKERLVDLEQKLKENMRANKKFETLCDGLKNECEMHVNELKKIEEERNSLQTEYFRCNEEKKELKKSLNEKSKEVENILIEYQGKLENSMEKIMGKDKKISELNEKIEQLRVDAAKFQADLRNKSEIEAEIEERNSEIEALIEENKKIIMDLRHSESDLQIQVKNNESLQKLIKTRENEMKNKTEELESLKKSLASKAEDSKELSQTRQQSSYLNERISKLEDQIKSLEHEKQDLIENIKNKDQEYSNLQTLIEEHKNIIKIKEKSLENLKFTLNDHQNLVNTLNSKEQYIQKTEERVKALSIQLNNSEKIIENLQDEKYAQNSLIKDLNSQLDLLKEIPKLQQEKQKFLDSSETSQKHISTLEKILKEKEDQLRIKDFKLKDQDSLTILNKELTERVSALKSENQTLTEQLKPLKDLPGLIKVKDQEINSLKSSLENDREYKKIIKAQQESSEKLESEYKDKIEVLQVKVEFFQSEKEKLALTLNEKTEQLSKVMKALNQTQVEAENLSSELSIKDTQLFEINSKCEEYEKKLLSLNEKLIMTVSEHEEACLGDKEEISRLNNALVRSENVLNLLKKDNFSLTQTISNLESKKSHCENCESQKQKISELECMIHSAEESLGGFFTNSLIESITNLISNKAQSLRKAPRPPLLRSRPEGQKRQSEELRPSIAEELISKSPMMTEGSKRSHSSALSLPDISDLRNELIEEKSENEKYLNQIRLLKENIRDLETRLKRTLDINEKINLDMLTNTLIKLVRALPVQNNEVESIISLVFSIISLPKEELLRLEPERKSKTGKKFGVF